MWTSSLLSILPIVVMASFPPASFNWTPCTLLEDANATHAPDNTLVVGQVMSVCMALMNASAAGSFGRYRVSLLIFNDLSMTANGPVAAELFNNYPVVSVIGAYSSRITIAMLDGDATHRGLTSSGIPLISGAATSPVLSDKAKYPHFMRVCSSDALTMLSKYGVTRIAGIGNNDSYGHGGLEKLVTYAARATPPIEVVSNIYYSPTIDSPKDLQKSSTNAEAFIVYCTSLSCLPLLDKAREMEMLESPNVWILELAKVITNNTRIFGMATAVDPNPLQKQFDSNFVQFIHADEAENIYMYFEYDAALALVYGLSKMIGNGQDPLDRSALYSTLTSLRFEGTTGTISFDSSGDRFASIRIYAWVHGDDNLEVVGSWSIGKGVTMDTRYAPWSKRSSSQRGYVVQVVGGVVGGFALVAVAGAVVGVVIGQQQRAHRIVLRKKLIHEVSVMKSLRHPNLLLFMCYARTDAGLTIVTEFMPGGSLFDVLSDRAMPMSLKTKLSILDDISSGMAYLHANDPPIIHCDLKSSNILRHEGGVAVNQHDDSVLGSLLWSAPEVISEGALSTKSDVSNLVMPPTGKMAIVFTDIQQSTELWEWNPTLMKEALYQHHDVMRATLRRHNGYEVRTEGDAFMIVFQLMDNLGPVLVLPTLNICLWFGTRGMTTTRDIALTAIAWATLAWSILNEAHRMVFSNDFRPKSPTALDTPRVRYMYTGCSWVLVFSHFFLNHSGTPTAPRWGTIAHAFVCLSLFALVTAAQVFAQPFYVKRSVYFATMCYAMAMWESLVACASVLISPGVQSHVLSIVLIALALGLALPVSLLSVAACRIRRNRLLKKAEDADLDGQQLTHSKKDEDEDIEEQVDPEKKLFQFEAEYFLATKFVYYNKKLTEAQTRLADAVLRRGIRDYPQSAYLYMIYAVFLGDVVHDPLKMHRNSSGSGLNSNEDDYAIDLALARLHHSAAKKAMSDFWSLIHKQRRIVDQTALLGTVSRVNHHDNAGGQIFERLLNDYPKDLTVIRAYAFFLDDIVDDKERAETLYQVADELEDLKARRTAKKSRVRVQEEGEGQAKFCRDLSRDIRRPSSTDFDADNQGEADQSLPDFRVVGLPQQTESPLSQPCGGGVPKSASFSSMDSAGELSDGRGRIMQYRNKIQSTRHALEAYTEARQWYVELQGQMTDYYTSYISKTRVAEGVLFAVCLVLLVFCSISFKPLLSDTEAETTRILLMLLRLPLNVITSVQAIRLFLERGISDLHEASKGVAEEQEQRTKDILGASKDAVLLTNEQLEVSYLNQAAEFLLAMSPDEVLGKSFSSFMPLESAAKLEAAATKFIKSREDSEVFLNQKDGTQVPVLLSAVGTQSAADESVSFGFFIKDISHIRMHAFELERQKRRADLLLQNILPASVVDVLKKEPGKTIAQKFDSVTILFADIVEFTPLAARTEPEKLVQLLNGLFSRWDALCPLYGVEKVKTIGDCFMAACGAPVPKEDHAAAMVEFAIDALRSLEQVNQARRSEGLEELRVRFGINSGSVVAGVIGRSKLQFDYWGDAVNVAARVEAAGLPGRINVSLSTYGILCNTYKFESRGRIMLKGKGEQECFVLINDEAPASPKSAAASRHASNGALSASTENIDMRDVVLDLPEDPIDIPRIGTAQSGRMRASSLSSSGKPVLK
eukprot:m51a1_g8760 putative family 3 adenylate cyclase (1662) ;mRNA; r:111354-126456